MINWDIIYFCLYMVKILFYLFWVWFIYLKFYKNVLYLYEYLIIGSKFFNMYFIIIGLDMIIKIFVKFLSIFMGIYYVCIYINIFFLVFKCIL